ncbi:hypothetical protein B0H13DRAFT_2539968 [Mycena leptocephala]|nr:hypothetical protein B0H13DRAFT_2539968 [Mycena leptocephala]
MKFRFLPVFLAPPPGSFSFLLSPRLNPTRLFLFYSTSPLYRPRVHTYTRTPPPTSLLLGFSSLFYFLSLRPIPMSPSQSPASPLHPPLPSFPMPRPLTASRSRQEVRRWTTPRPSMERRAKRVDIDDHWRTPRNPPGLTLLHFMDGRAQRSGSHMDGPTGGESGGGGGGQWRSVGVNLKTSTRAGRRCCIEGTPGGGSRTDDEFVTVHVYIFSILHSLLLCFACCRPAFPLVLLLCVTVYIHVFSCTILGTVARRLRLTPPSPVPLPYPPSYSLVLLSLSPPSSLRSALDPNPGPQSDDLILIPLLSVAQRDPCSSEASDDVVPGMVVWVPGTVREYVIPAVLSSPWDGVCGTVARVVCLSGDASPQSTGGGWREGLDLSRVGDGALACSAGRRTRARWSVHGRSFRVEEGQSAWVVVGASPRSDAPGGESAGPQGSSGRRACPVDERAPRVSFGGTSVFLADIDAESGESPRLVAG